MVTERRKGVARAALTALLADNAPQAAKDGIAMLRMLVTNLVKQSNVPRYRRITTRCVCVACQSNTAAVRRAEGPKRACGLCAVLCLESFGHWLSAVETGPFF